jgi:ATP-dependent RNA helicase DDX56/DBP9
MESFPFDLKLVEGFRYRSESTLQTITKNCIKEARFKEIRNEIMNSEKLKV